MVTKPRVVIFSGASCQGPSGTWYLNVVDGGSQSSTRLAYHLHWAFASAGTAAQPDGSVAVTIGSGQPKVTVSLQGGIVRISGRDSSGKDISATGTLAVHLASSGSKPQLVISESGLAQAEAALGIASPFGPGHSVSLPVESVPKVASC